MCAGMTTPLRVPYVDTPEYITRSSANGKNPCQESEGVSHVLDLSEGSSKLIPIHEEPNHQIVHLFRLEKANRPTH